jgi:RIO-like serine/threonine protein kinase
VVAFLFEELYGDFASIDDLQVCSEALQELHGLGILHGNINKYNIFLTADGPKFIDFEESILDSDKKAKSFNLEKLKAEEIKASPASC